MLTKAAPAFTHPKKQNNPIDLSKPLFNSFFMGGFECAYAKGESKRRLDLLRASKHDTYCREDYRLLKEMGISTVREGLAWSKIDKGGGEYDFTRFERMMKIGQEEGVQQIWDLNHFDYPDYLDPFSDKFVTQFARYAKKCIKLIRKYQPEGTVYIVPINEISFWAYIGGMIGLWAPYTVTKGYAFKKQLVRAAVAAMDAIWEVDKDVRFIQVDPLMYKTPKEPITIVKEATARSFLEIKYQTYDMLCGRLHPELGGHPKYLDLIGVNYYPSNQDWITADDPLDDSCHAVIPWFSKYRIHFADMLQEVYDRYGRPIVVTETGAWGSLRARWWKRTLREIDEAMERGLSVLGVCAYPVVDRPDWTFGHLTNSGFWDFESEDPKCLRIPHEESIKIAQKYIDRWSYKNKVQPIIIPTLQVQIARR